MPHVQVCIQNYLAKQAQNKDCGYMEPLHNSSQNKKHFQLLNYNKEI